MNQQDLNAMAEYWHRETRYINDKVDDAFKDAQDHAYQLGWKRGREEAKARFEPRPPLTDERITKLAEMMPGGLDGFLKGWGWQQFARAIEEDHGIGIEA